MASDSAPAVPLHLFPDDEGGFALDIVDADQRLVAFAVVPHAGMGHIARGQVRVDGTSLVLRHLQLGPASPSQWAVADTSGREHPITHEALARWTIDDLIAATRDAIVRWIVELEGRVRTASLDGWAFVERLHNTTSAETRRELAAWHSVAGTLRPAVEPTRPGARRLTGEFLERLSRRYVALHQEGVRAVVQALADEYAAELARPVSRNTVAQWLRKARKTGYLGSTTERRARPELGPMIAENDPPGSGESTK